MNESSQTILAYAADMNAFGHIELHSERLLATYANTKRQWREGSMNESTARDVSPGNYQTLPSLQLLSLHYLSIIYSSNFTPSLSSIYSSLIIFYSDTSFDRILRNISLF